MKIVPHPSYIMILPFEYENYRRHSLQETGLGNNNNLIWDSTGRYYLTTEKTFPVMGYRAPVEACIQGDPFAETHPKLWKETFGMKNYVYFEIKFLTKEEFNKLLERE